MFEKVNPSHPDKVADRIAGAIVDLAYSKNENPKCAVEVLVGHKNCLIINETDTHIDYCDIVRIVKRLVGNVEVNYVEVPQDKHLAQIQARLRCGDNGIFKGVPTSYEEKELTEYVKELYSKCEFDGKFIINDDRIIACQSNLEKAPVFDDYKITFNPLGYWTGGIDVDSGATNRKLGSDMGRSVTGGGLHGKDLSKADVSVNIYCYLMAQETEYDITCCCAIGDDTLTFYADGEEFTFASYELVVEVARKYIKKIGGFEKFAEWGLIR